MWFIIPALLTLHVAVCLLLVLVVLMQLPRSEGLGAAFGGSVTENIFGAQTTHVLAKFTVWLGIAFFVVTLLLAIAYAHRDSAKTAVQRDLMAPAAAVVSKPSATPAPVAAPVVPAASAAPSASPAASPVSSASPLASPAAP